jgi:hypothetical protein
MALHQSIYDLGEVDLQPPGRHPVLGSTAARRSPRPAAPRAVAFAAYPDSTGLGGIDWPAGLSTLVPGAGQIACGRFAAGGALLSVLGLLAAVGWALLHTMDRLAPTLVLLGHSRAAGVWILAGLFTLASLVHIAGVVTAGGQRGRGTPGLLAALASCLVPGWGQALQGRRAHAALFLAGLWLAGFTWLLAAPVMSALLADLRLILPAPLAIMSAPATRWTVPVVIWALAVYDAAHAGGAE